MAAKVLEGERRQAGRQKSAHNNKSCCFGLIVTLQGHITRQEYDPRLGLASAVMSIGNFCSASHVALQLLLEMEGGVCLAYCDARRFGKIRMQDDPENNEPISKLGFDPILSMPDLEAFTALLEGQRRAIKALILDQVRLRGMLACYCPVHACMHWYAWPVFSVHTRHPACHSIT